MKRGFSIVLTAYNAPMELELCLESIFIHSDLQHELLVIVDADKLGEVNEKVLEVLNDFIKTKREVRVFLNKKNLGPYGSWNKGARLAAREILCFLTDDQYLAPGWDKEIMEYTRKRRILSSQLIEPGVLFPSFGTIVKDFGDSAGNFKKKKFLSFVEASIKKGLIDGVFFIPLVLYKKEFLELGGFPVSGEFGSKDTVANDVAFIRSAIKLGFEFKTSLGSFSYHFQARSWIKFRKIKKLITKMNMKFGLKKIIKQEI